MFPGRTGMPFTLQDTRVRMNIFLRPRTGGSREQELPGAQTSQEQPQGGLSGLGAEIAFSEISTTYNKEYCHMRHLLCDKGPMLPSSVLRRPREKGAISFLWMRKQKLRDRLTYPASHGLQGVGVAPGVTAHALKRLVLYVFIYVSIERQFLILISFLKWVSSLGCWSL